MVLEVATRQTKHVSCFGDDSFEELDNALRIGANASPKKAVASHWSVNNDLSEDKSVSPKENPKSKNARKRSPLAKENSPGTTQMGEMEGEEKTEGYPNKRSRTCPSPLQQLPNSSNDRGEDEPAAAVATKVTSPKDAKRTLMVGTPGEATMVQVDGKSVEPSPQGQGNELARAVGEVAEAMLAMASQGPPNQVVPAKEEAKPNSRKRNSPCFFTQQEDLLLAQLVERRGPRAWSKIALSFPFKNGKQCRARWYTHLDPAVRKLPFSLEEDGLLLSKHAELGNCWSTIAKGITGRTELSVRNRWNAHLRARVESSGMTEDAYAKRLLRAVEFGAGAAQANPPPEEQNTTETTDKQQRSRVGCAQYSCVSFTTPDLGLSFEPSPFKGVQDRLARVVMIKGEEAMKGKVKVGMVVLTVNDTWCPSLSFQETFNMIQNSSTRPIAILFGDESLIPDESKAAPEGGPAAAPEVPAPAEAAPITVPVNVAVAIN
eukprot:TRINITY_DN913_c0_g1_i5.p1 TRINITY_DN913_c0_g1~~TRINITY_DN913_c0_g1_i5.p1  ORF type:complete len:489 (+),score=113.84 TRINITY_DN913_c0_g1_i5:176-1642(+)